jgi:hypothetical protein
MSPETMPQRIQLSRAKGWRMPPNTVKVARPGRWGNLYRVDVFGRDLALKLYRESLQGFWSPGNVVHLSDELAAEAYRCHCELRDRVRRLDVLELRGKNVACFCGLDEPCHGDVLLELANGPP